jgi:hypothetical protein
MRIHALGGWYDNHFEKAQGQGDADVVTKYGSHLPTTQCACANFLDFATQRNGRRGREKDL